MKRTDITALFPDATDEQIKAIMDLNGADINSAKKGVTDLQAQLEAAQEQLSKAADADKVFAELESTKSELNGMKQAETMRLMREKVAAEKNVPAHLLSGESEDACAEQANAILTFAKGFHYPTVPDGGEVHNTPKTQTRDQFADWAKDNL